MKKRPLARLRMTAEATAMHRWVLPVPVPPMKIALRLASRKVPVASSRTCPSSIGVSAKVNVSISLRTGNLAPPILLIPVQAAHHNEMMSPAVTE